MLCPRLHALFAGGRSFGRATANTLPISKEAQWQVYARSTGAVRWYGAFPPPCKYALPGEQQQHDPRLVAATKVIKELRQNNFVAYIAGGWVRDQFLGRAAADIDIVTDASPAELQELPYTFLKGHQTYEVHRDGYVFEVTWFKGYQRAAEKHAALKAVKVNALPPHYTDPAFHDAVRRDFTINALLYDPLESDPHRRVIDFVGGLRDLLPGHDRPGHGCSQQQQQQAQLGRAHQKPAPRPEAQGVLRMCPAPEGTGYCTGPLQEDPVRVVRAARMCAQFNLRPEPATLRELQKVASESYRDVAGVGGGRLIRELKKMHALDNTGSGSQQGPAGPQQLQAPPAQPFPLQPHPLPPPSQQAPGAAGLAAPGSHAPLQPPPAAPPLSPSASASASASPLLHAVSSGPGVVDTAGVSPGRSSAAAATSQHPGRAFAACMQSLLDYGVLRSLLLPSGRSREGSTARLKVQREALQHVIKHVLPRLPPTVPLELKLAALVSEPFTYTLTPSSQTRQPPTGILDILAPGGGSVNSSRMTRQALVQHEVWTVLPPRVPWLQRAVPYEKVRSLLAKAGKGSGIRLELVDLFSDLACLNSVAMFYANEPTSETEGFDLKSRARVLASCIGINKMDDLDSHLVQLYAHPGIDVCLQTYAEFFNPKSPLQQRFLGAHSCLRQKYMQRIAMERASMMRFSAY